MPITFKCAACGHKIRAPEATIGKRARCKCGATLIVPAGSPALPTQVASASPPVEDQPVVSTQSEARYFMYEVLGDIILIVTGLVLGLIAFARVVSLQGQFRSWSPPFDDYEIWTFVLAGGAALCLTYGLTCLILRKKG
jgi:hypothetical protein